MPVASPSNSRFERALVAYYGLYQAVHTLVNVRGLVLIARGDPPRFPAPPPDGGWSPQAMGFLTAVGTADLVGAVLALVFVAGYFRGAPWRWWLGTLALTISMYALVVYDWGTLASGAWPGGLAAYLFVNVTLLPVLALFVLVCRRGARGDFA